MPTTAPSSAQEAWLAARDSDEDVTFDDDALNPHFSYLDERSLRTTSGFSMRSRL